MLNWLKQIFIDLCLIEAKAILTVGMVKKFPKMGKLILLVKVESELL